MQGLRIYHERYGFIEVKDEDSFLEKHLALSASELVKSICWPLRKLGITYFLYIKRFADGSQIEMTNIGDFTGCYYKNRYYLLDPFGNTKKLFDNGVFLWNTLDCQPIHQAIKEDFGVDHGLVTVYKHSDSNEFFHFGTCSGACEFSDLYLNHFELFTRFIFYFKDKTKKLRKQLEENRIILPDKSGLDNVINSGTGLFDRDTFVSLTPIDTCYINDDVYLTKREIECLKLHLTGKTAIEIARVLFISTRTVEVHLENIKRKLACNKQVQLSYKCVKLGLPIDW